MRPPSGPADQTATLSVVIPCFNEERTLARCLQRLLEITDDTLSLEIVIVDDCSTDRSLTVARELATKYPNVRVLGGTKGRERLSEPASAACAASSLPYRTPISSTTPWISSG